MDVILYIWLVFLWPLAISFLMEKRQKIKWHNLYIIYLLSINLSFMLGYYLFTKNSIISMHRYTPLFVGVYMVISAIIMIVIALGYPRFQMRVRTLIAYPKSMAVVGVIAIVLLTLTTWNSSMMPETTFQHFIYNFLVPTAMSNVDFFKDLFPIGSFLLIHCLVWIYLVMKGRLKDKIITRGQRHTIIVVIISSLLISLAFPIFSFQLYRFYDYLNFDGHYFEENYVLPSSANIIAPEKKRNLIYIFLESYEATYFDSTHGGASEENLLPGLTQLMQTGDNFSNRQSFGGGRPLAGMSWSIAGQVSYMSGVPLLLPFTEGNSYGLDGVFLPGLVTMGDILADDGYKQYLMMGVDKHFAGTDSFFTNHGSFEITDIQSKKDDGTLPKDYHEWWGFEDEKLFDYSRKKLQEISQADDPFNLVMLTSNTHFPDGYTSSSCTYKNEDPYSQSIYCNDQQVSQFISWVMDQPFYDETTIVLVGDHLSMDAEHFKGIDPKYQRTTFNLILNSKANRKSAHFHNRQFTSTDYFPTVLASLGYTIKGDRLGLGTNLYSETPTLMERDGSEVVNDELCKTDLYYSTNFLNVKPRQRE